MEKSENDGMYESAAVGRRFCRKLESQEHQVQKTKNVKVQMSY